MTRLDNEPPERRKTARKKGAPAGRLPYLDGLRGVASLVVVFHHVLLASAVFGNLHESGGRPELFSPAWWFSYTPLHIVWAGDEAVLVFFVLSGYVLSAQMLGTGRPWRKYFVQRLPRLYLPSIASVLLAVAAATAVARVDVPEVSLWINHHEPPSIPSVIRNSLLILGVDTLNSPLWSLQWEVWFSMLLPVYVWMAVKAGSSPLRGLLLAAMLFAMVLVGSYADNNALKYLPVFGFGVLMYSFRSHLADFAHAMGRKSVLVWPGMYALGILSLMSYWMVQAVPDVPRMAITASHLPQITGALVIVFIALFSQQAQRILTQRVVLWLGSRSFSLYLIHEPIVVSVALLFGGAKIWLVMLISVPLALVLAELFFRCIEQPSHAFARKLR